MHFGLVLHQIIQEHKAHKDLLALRAQLEFKVQSALKVHKETLVLKVLKDLQGLVVQQVHKAHKDQQVLLVFKER